ncbi:hypothetical protein ACWEQC_00250 [Streptomyces shenzhenensis]
MLTTSEVGPVIAIGTALTTAGALATLATGYRAAQHYITYKTNQAAIAALAKAIVTHDATVAKQEPPDAKVVHLSGAHTRRLT